MEKNYELKILYRNNTCSIDNWTGDDVAVTSLFDDFNKGRTVWIRYRTEHHFIKFSDVIEIIITIKADI